jgi:hypothetical protein
MSAISASLLSAYFAVESDCPAHQGLAAILLQTAWRLRALKVYSITPELDIQLYLLPA